MFSKSEIAEAGLVILGIALTLSILPKLAALLAIYAFYRIVKELPLKDFGIITRLLLVR